MRRPGASSRLPSPRRLPPALGHPDDDVEGILDFAEREIRGARSSMDLRKGAVMAFLGLASGLERSAGCALMPQTVRCHALARLGAADPSLASTYRRLQHELQRECFHQGRCSRADLAKAAATARKLVASLPARLPR